MKAPIDARFPVLPLSSAPSVWRDLEGNEAVYRVSLDFGLSSVAIVRHLPISLPRHLFNLDPSKGSRSSPSSPRGMAPGCCEALREKTAIVEARTSPRICKIPICSNVSTTTSRLSLCGGVNAVSRKPDFPREASRARAREGEGEPLIAADCLRSPSAFYFPRPRRGLSSPERIAIHLELLSSRRGKWRLPACTSYRSNPIENSESLALRGSRRDTVESRLIFKSRDVISSSSPPLIGVPASGC